MSFFSSTHLKTNIYGEELHLIMINDQKYLIGVEISKLLQRETYNVYRSMRAKGIAPIRLENNNVGLFLKEQIVKYGTRSMTLIPYDAALEFIKEEMRKISKRKRSNTTEIVPIESPHYLDTDKPKIMNKFLPLPIHLPLPQFTGLIETMSPHPPQFTGLIETVPLPRPQFTKLSKTVPPSTEKEKEKEEEENRILPLNKRIKTEIQIRLSNGLNDDDTAAVLVLSLLGPTH